MLLSVDTPPKVQPVLVGVTSAFVQKGLRPGGRGR